MEGEHAAGRDVVVVGASAGGVEALTRLVRSLPADLEASILIVLHVHGRGTSILPAILARAGAMPAMHPADRQAIEHGRIYVAPPDRHLLVDDDVVRVANGPKENGHRPAINPLFRTAASSFGPRVIGVILSGALDDGTEGLALVKRRGGYTIVQDPDDALYPSMPRSAIAFANPDRVLPLAEIPRALVNVVAAPLPDPPERGAGRELDPLRDRTTAGETSESPQRGGASGYSCPECGGSLWQQENEGLVRFRCRVGHAYSIESLVSNQGGALEAALCSRDALEKRAALSRRIADRMLARGNELSGARFRRLAAVSADHATLLRHLLDDMEFGGAPETADGTR